MGQALNPHLSVMFNSESIQVDQCGIQVSQLDLKYNSVLVALGNGKATLPESLEDEMKDGKREPSLCPTSSYQEGLGGSQDLSEEGDKCWTWASEADRRLAFPLHV